MKMQEMYELNSRFQVVLSFSNNEWVLLSAACFEDNSEFIRRSRVRLEQDFYLVESTDERSVYRTYRGAGLCDYVAYVNKGDYMVLEHFRKHMERSKTLRKTADRQKSVKNDTPPNKRPVIYATPYVVSDEEILIRMTYNSERLYEERIFRNDKYYAGWHSGYNYYNAIIRIMSRLVDHEELRDGIKELVIYNSVPYKRAKSVWAILTGDYETKYGWHRKLHDEFQKNKAKLQELDITVSYVLEEAS